MSNFNLIYSISKRTPATPKALKEILDVQTAVNRVATWSHERLSLAAPQAQRGPLVFPFMRFGHLSDHVPSSSDGFGASSPVQSNEAFAQGSTRVRDNLLNAHLVAAFCRHVSRLHPTLVFELRDEGGFVIPGAVLMKGGQIQANHEMLNRERARVLELTGDPQTAAPFVWAELQALAGAFFVDGPVAEYHEVPEIKELDCRWEQLTTMSCSEAAQLVVERAIQTAALVVDAA